MYPTRETRSCYQITTTVATLGDTKTIELGLKLLHFQVFRASWYVLVSLSLVRKIIRNQQAVSSILTAGSIFSTTYGQTQPSRRAPVTLL